MEVGNLVYNEYHGILRFGTIKSKIVKDDGWAYFKVNWHCDEVYERAMKHREELCHTNYYLEEYRKDQLKPICRIHLKKIVDLHESLKRGTINRRF